MPKARVLARLTLLAVGLGLVAHAKGASDSPPIADTLVIRLVQPDRQAAELLKLFDGARVAHPAAALAAWKRATHDSNQLGKPLEAAIALLNPEMVREWKVLRDAELCLDLGAADGIARWYAVVPRDDGTFSAVVTAMRLTDGAAVSPLSITNGKELAVERLGPNDDALVTTKSGDALIVGTSRDQLVRGLRRIRVMAVAVPPDAALANAQPVSPVPGPAPTPASDSESGLFFDLNPGRMNARAGTTANRQAAAFLQGLGCQRIQGKLALAGDLLTLEMTTLLKRGQSSPPTAAARPAVVDPSWLTWVPARDAMGVISLAIEPGAAFWDTAFAVADRVDRADPARANLAPLRTRFNLLAAAAGVRLDTDLWPHLRGVTACVAVDPRQPGRPGGILVVLHMDAVASAERLTNDLLPRLSGLLTGKKPAGPASRKAAAERPAAGPAESSAELGTVGGRSLLVSGRGRDVLIAWGKETLSAANEAAAKPERSVAPLCTHWAREGKQPPQRLGAIWPGRWQSPVANVDAKSPAWQALAEDPPAIWWGWNGPDQAADSLQYAGLSRRVHQFLEQLPLDPPPLP